MTKKFEIFRRREDKTYEGDGLKVKNMFCVVRDKSLCP